MPIVHRQWMLAFLVAICMAVSIVPIADDIGESHVDAAFKRALVGFALARALNGVISVAQGTEIAVQPAGIGVNFTPGQILDPVNDLIERFSWIMLLASSSLGIQKILLAMSAWEGLLLGVLVCGGVLIAALTILRLHTYRQLLQRLFLFLLLLRFMMPAISIANDWVYRIFLQDDYIEASASLEQAQQAIGSINEEVRSQRQQQEPTTLIERAKTFYENALDKVDIDRRLDQYRVAAESISENTITLVVVFLMQTVVFPLIFLFVVLGIIRRLVRF
ncbi:MAG: hypothetical protein KTR32_40180 [Granulosicoccus sp.]|nr:hypothetical protein [Granulosicoccus sp.]